jgi:hypothetical protein
MDRREFLRCTSMGLATAVSTRGFTAEVQSSYDLAALAAQRRLTVFNGQVSELQDGTRRGIRLSPSSGQALAFVSGPEFANGTIDVDIRGRDVLQQSFVGVAFHAMDALRYDAVYFRPFNFRSSDAERRAHAVQYESMPGFPWQKLRTERPGTFEKAVSPVPDPNGWFRARIVVASPEVRVFVEHAETPSLVVTQLSDRGRGMVGVWTDNFGGDFANLVITPARV